MTGQARELNNLEKKLCENRFVVTAELGPPKGADPEYVREHARILKGYADAVNVTDNQRAVVRLSSLASSLIMMQEGLEPIMQMTCRDRNRIALQSDLLGACSLGIKNVLCLTGDHQSMGDHKGAKNVYDLDSIQLLSIIKKMRDEKKDFGGKELTKPPNVFIGAAANPFADPFEFRVIRLEKKANAGAQFIQTQAVFDIPRFEKFMELVRSRKLDNRLHIIAGVLPIKGPKMLRNMKENVAGVSIPDSLIQRMEMASDKKEEGIKIALETIETIRKIKGVKGIHIMAVAWEDVIPRIVKESGLIDVISQ